MTVKWVRACLNGVKSDSQILSSPCKQMSITERAVVEEFEEPVRTIVVVIAKLYNDHYADVYSTKDVDRFLKH